MPVLLDFDPIDDHGYPTEELLEFISSWPYQKGFKDLMDIVYDYWSYDYPYKFVDFTKDGGYWVYEMSTGGWSGNEALIEALQGNHMFWLINWYSSRRGGHYVFKVRADEDQT